MAAKESEAMKKARKLVTQGGLTPYAAAQKVGLTRSAIYMAPWYKEWKKNAKSAKEGLEAAFAHAKERRRVPDELPDHVAMEMAKAYHANAREGIKGRVAGMQAAWRVFLDTVEV